MKKFILTYAVLAIAGFTALAQHQVPPAGYEYTDSIIFTPVPPVDSLLKGRDIFSVMPENVTVVQSGAIKASVLEKARTNEGKMQNGFRIRIFFDNSQSARSGSEAALYRFKMKYPEVAAYRSFTSPYFKVTVGDYRNKSEALEALSEIRKDFPTAFIVRERFKYPSMQNTASFRMDTVRVLRPVKR